MGWFSERAIVREWRGAHTIQAVSLDIMAEPEDIFENPRQLTAQGASLKFSVIPTGQQASES